jgi:hypothetical protein
MREITFKFPKDDVNQNKLLVTSKEKNDLLTNISTLIDKIYNSNLNFLNKIINQVSTLTGKNQ